MAGESLMQVAGASMDRFAAAEAWLSPAPAGATPIAAEGSLFARLDGCDADRVAIIFNNVPDALFLLSAQAGGRWCIASCNRTTGEMFGIATQALIGRTLDDIFGTGALSRDGESFVEGCSRTGMTIEEECYLAVHRDDFWLDYEWWHIKMVPIPGRDGRIDQIACICQMVTEDRQIRDSLKQFTSAISQAGNIIAIVELDGTIDFINPAFERQSGVTADTARGHSIFRFCEPPDAHELYAPLKAAMAGMASWQGELPSINSNGARYWENVHLSPIVSDKGIPERYLIVKEDITERRRVEKQLRLASRVLETTDAGVLVTDTHGIIESVNPAFSAITGYTMDEALGASPRLLRSERHDAPFYAAMWQELATQGHWSGEFINRKKCGDSFVCSMSISALNSPDGTVTHYVGVFSDITELKNSQRQLENLANFDPLTGLPNRRHIQERLAQSLCRATREGQNIAVMYFDLDHFKAVNDTLGHPAGDALLQEVSRRTLAQLRQEDTLARLGGDEFVALLECVTQPEIISVVAERVIAELRRPFSIQGQDVFIGCSIGIAFFPKDAADSETLQRYADLALYRAKDEGRNCYRLYSDELNAKAHDRYRIEAKLRRVLETGELSVVYQPQCDIVSGQTLGAEALLRWHNAELGSVSPVTFIPIAEQTGLIIPITSWVLEQICRTQQRLMTAGCPLRKIAINVSPVQFKHEDTVATFVDVLSRHGIAPQCIEIEVTEGTIIDNPERAVAMLEQLRQCGFSVAVDDFGTGYSSLGSLKRLPIDKLKIDRTFVSELGTDPDDAVIVSAIVAMSKHLGLTTLAEGVETERQLEYLRFAGCDEVQGYLTGKPMSEAALLDHLAHRGGRNGDHSVDSPTGTAKAH